MKETRHFAYARGQRLHFRKFGMGPPVVLIHESPRSSIATMALAGRLAQRFTTLSFDNFGFGLSTALPHDRPSIEDFADYFAEALRSIGVERAVMYGVHTGASIAMELGRRHPSLASLALLDGYPLFTAKEQSEFLHGYLAPFKPDWHGRFVAWLWARVRDQYTFFPWNLAGGGLRLPRTPPPLAQHMAVVRDFLMAGDHYRPAYAAAFRYDPLPALSQSSTPTIHATRDTDLLVSHLDRLPESASKAGMVHRLKGSDLDEWAGAIGNLIEGYPGTADLRHDQDWAPVQGQGMAVHNADAGPLYVHFAGNPGHGTTLLIHDSPGSAVAQQRLIGSLAEEGRVVAPELPGHGWSPPLADVDDHRLAISDRIAEALGALSVGAPVRIIGLGLGGAVAFELAKKFEVPLILLNPPRPDVKPNSYAPALTDSWYGGHLLAAFYQARDAMIYDPWYDRRQECARAMDPDPDMAALFAAFRDIVLSENGYRTLAMEALDDRRWIDAGQSLISADRPDALDLANALGGVVVASTEEAVAQIRTIAA